MRELLGKHPGIAYVKWDCNRKISDPGSAWLDARHQGNLAIDYVRGYESVLDALAGLDLQCRAAPEARDADLLRGHPPEYLAMLERQRSLIEQAKATVDADLAQVEFAEHELQRYQHLAGQGAGTLQNSQQAKNRSLTARAELAQHKAALEAARQQTRVLAARATAAQASVQYAEALLARADLDLSHTQLLAPFDGVVGRRSVRLGAYVKPGDTVLAVVPLADAYVVANFLEHQLTNMQAGQRVTIKVDSFPGQTLQGTVDSIAPATGVTFSAIAPDNATGNFTKVAQRIAVKVTLDHGQLLASQLRLGMSVDASIDTAMAHDQQVSTR